jgi:hypothetical protein
MKRLMLFLILAALAALALPPSQQHAQGVVSVRKYTGAAAGGGAPPLGTLLSDSFEGTTGTTLAGRRLDTDQGTGWVSLNGDFQIQNEVSGGKAVAAFNGSDMYAEANNADVTMSVTLYRSGAAGAYLLFRQTNTNDRWYVNFESSGTIALHKGVGGVDTTVASTSATFNAFTNYVVSIVTSGSSIIVKLDGTTVLSTTDSDLQTATRYGIYGASNNGNLLHDNFTVTSP